MCHAQPCTLATAIYDGCANFALRVPHQGRPPLQGVPDRLSVAGTQHFIVVGKQQLARCKRVWLNGKPPECVERATGGDRGGPPCGYKLHFCAPVCLWALEPYACERGAFGLAIVARDFDCYVAIKSRPLGHLYESHAR